MFVPATLPLLRRWSAGSLRVDAATGFAVTPALREWYAAGDTEELEDVALTDAARASLRLLAADPLAARRRVVVAVEVAGASPDATIGRAGVRLRGPVTSEAVAAVYVDDAGAESAVRAAVDGLDAADAGDPDSAFTVEEAEGHELLWFAVQEITDLIEP